MIGHITVGHENEALPILRQREGAVPPLLQSHNRIESTAFQVLTSDR